MFSPSSLVVRMNNFITNKNSHLKIARRITKLLDIQFSIWKFKFGLDPILGMIPGLGDVITTVLSLYIVFVAILHRIPTLRIIQMIFNILVDFIIGAVPVLGDVLDFVIKPNVKNLAILEKEIAATIVSDA